MAPLITIITPTTGSQGINRLIQSIDRQNIPYVHILLWDDKREGEFLYPENTISLNIKQPHEMDLSNIKDSCRYSIVIPGTMVQGIACGSALRAIGIMAANTPYITFADSDVWWDDGHLESLLDAVEGNQWAYCKRRVWANNTDCIGIDNFESVGDSPDKKVPYEMVDNNCMIFTRRLGTSGAVLYRETKEYNDDRLFYKFLKQYGGNPEKTGKATVNQICPKRLEPMFRQYCEKE